jgi:FKBP-type peptidyl-prolyl cis-trans isomerase
MTEIRLTTLVIVALAVSSCGKAGDDPANASKQAAEPTKASQAAEIDIAAIESVEIVPGLSRRIIREGSGAVAAAGHTAVVHYTGWLFDENAPHHRGAKFDSSRDRGQYFEFPLGGGRVIRGWDQGVVGMQLGELRELTIAPEMAYGDRGAGALIPPGATLIFEVELADLKGLEADEPETP